MLCLICTNRDSSISSDEDSNVFYFLQLNWSVGSWINNFVKVVCVSILLQCSCELCGYISFDLFFVRDICGCIFL